jgi:hypothetical protein
MSKKNKSNKAKASNNEPITPQDVKPVEVKPVEVLPETSIDVTAREKSTVVNGKRTKGKILDTGKVFQYSTDQKGHDAFINRYQVKEMMSLVNRQLKTDCRNELAAAAKAPEKGLKSKCKVMLEMVKTNAALKPIFIEEVEKWVHVDKAAKAAIIEILAAA